MSEYNAHFEYNCFYHIYNRGNNKENIFKEEKNYSSFLKKWNAYLMDYVNLWIYCLLPNHFHLIIEIKPKKELSSLLTESRYDTINDLISNQFRRVFISYSKSFNKVYDRTGSLFQKRFKRVKVDTENYLLSLIHYIHHNPIHHNFTEDFTDWKYSSYAAMIGNGNTKVERNKVLELFGGKDKFIRFHSDLKEYKKIRPFLIE